MTMTNMNPNLITVKTVSISPNPRTPKRLKTIKITRKVEIHPATGTRFVQYNNIDGGSFQDGYSNNTAQGLAASELHTFRSNLINEFRFGFNYLKSHRYNLYSNVNVSAQLPIPFPGVPFEAGENIGGLPSLSFGDGTAAIGASEFLPAIEKQHSYVFTDNLNWIRGRHAAKFGGELRFEQFTLLEPAAPRGYMDFGGNFLINDNLADPVPAARPSPLSCRAFPTKDPSPV